MPSPFPGMDPYLEGAIWPDVHHALATGIRRALVPQLRPHYVARIEVSVIEDGAPEAELGILYPDVEVLRRRAARSAPDGHEAYGAKAGASTGRAAGGPALAAPLTLPLPAPFAVRVPSIELRDAANDELVTAIELLSPVNKRQPALEAYRRKRDRLRRAGVHLLEVDLLRRGQRPLQHAGLPLCDYLVTLTRAGAGEVEVWPLALADPLPTLPVPLRAPDPDASFDLGAVLRQLYDEAAYDLSIDYAAAPPPPLLTPEQEAWRAGLVAR